MHDWASDISIEAMKSILFDIKHNMNRFKPPSLNTNLRFPPTLQRVAIDITMDFGKAFDRVNDEFLSAKLERS